MHSLLWETWLLRGSYQLTLSHWQLSDRSKQYMNTVLSLVREDRKQSVSKSSDYGPIGTAALSRPIGELQL